jgi:hypothetical protein
VPEPVKQLWEQHGPSVLILRNNARTSPAGK